MADDAQVKARRAVRRARTVPCPATLAWMIEAQVRLNGPNCDLPFPTPNGRLWRQRNFYRDIWKHLRAAGINDADLAEIAGHRVETMLARYTHPVGGSFDAIRMAIE